jgi:hypothetical protein
MTDDETPDRYIAIFGNIEDGYDFYGPFDSFEAAQRFIYQGGDGEGSRIVKLEPA